MLDRYVDQVEKPEVKKRLSAEIAKIRFESIGGVQVAVGLEAGLAFDRADASELYKDLVHRLPEFIDETDLQALRSV